MFCGCLHGLHGLHTGLLMLLPTLGLGLILTRYTRYLSRNKDRANVNRREGIIISNTAASSMAVNRLALNIVLESISSRIRLIINGRLRRIERVLILLVEPSCNYDLRIILIRRLHYANYDMSNMAILRRHLDDVRREDLLLHAAT